MDPSSFKKNIRDIDDLPSYSNESSDILKKAVMSMMDLNTSMVKLIEKVENKVCGEEEFILIVETGKQLLENFKVLFLIVSQHDKEREYSALIEMLKSSVDDFKEYLADFMFRHDKVSQDEINEMLRDFSLRLQ